MKIKRIMVILESCCCFYGVENHIYIDLLLASLFQKTPTGKFVHFSSLLVHIFTFGKFIQNRTDLANHHNLIEMNRMNQPTYVVKGDQMAHLGWFFFRFQRALVTVRVNLWLGSTRLVAVGRAAFIETHGVFFLVGNMKK